jgi:hypothetical protein
MPSKLISKSLPQPSPNVSSAAKNFFQKTGHRFKLKTPETGCPNGLFKIFSALLSRFLRAGIRRPLPATTPRHDDQP